MAAFEHNFSKMISAQLRNKANEFLNSRRHANNLADILQMFEVESENYTPLLLTVEVIFTELLKRGDLFEEIIPLKPNDYTTPEGQYKKWLKECYEATWNRTLSCMTRARGGSRLQALVTACKLLQAEGRYPLEPQNGFSFPVWRLKMIFTTLLDSDTLMSAPITRFQEFTEYKDVQQYGLKVLASMAYRKSPTSVFMQNYLELLDKLLTVDIVNESRTKDKDRDGNKEDKILCSGKGRSSFMYNSIVCRRYANRCWAFACQWPLCAEPRTQRRALLLLVEKLMPLLSKPHLATDMLCDSLDAGGPISILALQGVLELVRRHNIDYPDIYERLYAMFETEMFATRHKRRLLHLTDIFLSSTHLPETLVAAFAKRLSRLALVAPPEDATGLLQLVANLLLRHPCLKRMICYEDTPAIMSSDPYVMEETSAAASGALGSSLWELCALRRHWLPAVCLAADALLAAAAESRTQPLNLHLPDEQNLFDAELKKRFKSIEMNFIRPVGATLPSGERFTQYWEVAA